MVTIGYSKSVGKLHISKAPSLKSWCILFGLILLGVSTSFYSPGNLGLKTLYLLGCVGIGLCFLEDWQDCVVDRSLARATLTRCNWYERLTRLAWEGHYVELPLDSVVAARVVLSESGGGEVSRLVLVLQSGRTQTIVQDGDHTNQSILSELCQELSSFLLVNHLELMQNWEDRSLRASLTASVSTTSSEVSIPPAHLHLLQQEGSSSRSSPAPSTVTTYSEASVTAAPLLTLHAFMPRHPRIHTPLASHVLLNR